MKKNYYEMAGIIRNAKFWMAGYGHFDLTQEDMALVLELADKRQQKLLENFYAKLANERL